MHCVIYDGNCNLCVNLVRLLAALDQGQRFQYVPMQDAPALARFGLTPADGQGGMIVIDLAQPQRRWQGSDAAEEIARLLPAGAPLIAAYRALPGLKAGGDQVYGYVRDNRYQLFGQRQQVYHTAFPFQAEAGGDLDSGQCADGQCQPPFAAAQSASSDPAG